MAFDQTTRNRLQRFVNDARRVLEEEFTRQLQNDYGMDPNAGSVAELTSLRHINDAQRETARILRDTLAHYTASGDMNAMQGLDRIVRERYSPADWNIYAAQASDGDNIPDDVGRCIDLVENHLLPASQYFAYIEVSEHSGPGETVAWHGYSEIAQRHKHFAMRRVTNPGEIFPVFHDLFSSSSGG